MLSDVSQVQEDKYCMMSLTCGILKIEVCRSKEQKGGQGLGGEERGDAGQNVQSFRDADEYVLEI